VIDAVSGHVISVGSVIVAKSRTVVASHHRPTVMVGARLSVLHYEKP
jgi:hypothetical protein